MSKKDYKQMEAHARKKISYIKDIHAADRMSVEFFKGYDDLLEALILQGEKQEAKVMIKSEVWEAFFLPDYAYNSFNEENILDKYFNLCSSAEEMEEFIADTAALLKGKADDEYVAGNIDKAYQKYGRVMHFILSAKENPDIHMSEFIPLIVECRIAQSKILEWKNESGAALKLLEETYRLVLIKIWRETPQTLEAVVYLSIRLADLYAICDDDKSAIIHYDTAVQLANLLNEKEQGMRFNAIIAQTQLKRDQMKKRDI